MPFSLNQLLFWKKNSRSRIVEIAPDEVMLDSSNISDLDTVQFEGRLEKPISRISLYSICIIFIIVAGVFIYQAVDMQIIHGYEYLNRSERNILRPVPLFAGRGIISDRNNILLVWNAPSDKSISTGTAELVASREYSTSTGLAHVLGYVQYPSKDNNGFYYQNDFEGVAGVEKYYNSSLQGNNGSRLVEVDAHGNIISENVVKPPDQGKSIELSIDSRVQSALYSNIKDIAGRVGFSGGAGIIMDIHTGELIALTSYPEYSSQVMSDKTDINKVRSLLSDKDLPFLDRAINGLYTPGSIVKPYVALGILTENIIDPNTIIVTNGSISIPNPYDSTKSTIFKDWKNNGALDIRHAIAQSSDAYFYIVGGGYKDQKGLGIINIDKYLRLFSLGTAIPESFVTGKIGTIPTPEWKKTTFNEEWFVGNTYHTAIGQYGFQVTPVQMIRAVASLANNGIILIPNILKTDTPNMDHVITEISLKNFQIVKEGMRLSVTDGVAKALNVPYIDIAAKSGTAELGVSKDKVNSWITGFWPYENPRYAFVVMLEKGSVHNLVGAAAAMKQQLDWMNENTPEYFK